MLLIISPDPFFQYWPGCPSGPKTEIPYRQKLLNAGLGVYTGGKIYFLSNFLSSKCTNKVAQKPSKQSCGGHNLSLLGKIWEGR